MPSWRIYYDDMSTYSDDDGPVEDAPGIGVVLIVCADPSVGRVVLGGETCYGYHEERKPEPTWDQHDNFGLMDYLMRIGWKKVIFGRSVSDKRYREVWDAVLADKDFVPKSGKPYRPDEELPLTNAQLPRGE